MWPNPKAEAEIARSPAPVWHDDAKRLLETRGLKVEKIVRVDTELAVPRSVLFVECRHGPMTAWLWPGEDGPRVEVQFGFGAEPGFLEDLRDLAA